jgi:ribosomal protein S18 acetylase RimI-like enzyme
VTPEATFAALARSFVATSRAIGVRQLVAGERPGLIYGAIGGSIAGFNRLMATAMDPVTADADVAAALDELDGFPVLSAWLPPDVQPPDLDAIFVARGFVEDEERVPAMFAELGNLPEPEPPTGTRWYRVTDGPAAERATDVMVAGFETPAELRPFLADFASQVARQSAAPLRFFLAELDGIPVATSFGAVADSTLVIYNVATIPEARGRGLGRLVTLVAMREAVAMGAKVAVLESSEIGLSVYRRLGFTEVGRYRVLLRARSGPG